MKMESQVDQMRDVHDENWGFWYLTGKKRRPQQHGEKSCVLAQDGGGTDRHRHKAQGRVIKCVCWHLD